MSTPFIDVQKKGIMKKRLFKNFVELIFSFLSLYSLVLLLLNLHIPPIRTALGPVAVVHT